MEHCSAWNIDAAVLNTVASNLSVLFFMLMTTKKQ
jgi:hypothetical protein